MAIYYYDFHEERGEFRGYVEDANGKDVWRVTYPDFYEDEESGELVEGSTIFEDGYMKDATDIEGLEDYLKKIGVLQHGDELEFIDDEELFSNGGEIKWQDVNRGDSARVKSENKMGLIVHTYGRKFNLKFPNGKEKTYDASELEFIKDEEESFGVGGSLESRVVKKIKSQEPFELPLELSVYVPSTREASQIISKRDYNQRIEEVQRFLADLFGGFSSVSVEGGYVSSDKGLIQEDATRVVAFASRVDFEKKLDTLLKQIVDWCKKWSQESIGFEFEGDLFYISEKSEFEYGGQVIYKDGGENDDDDRSYGSYEDYDEAFQKKMQLKYFKKANKQSSIGLEGGRSSRDEYKDLDEDDHTSPIDIPYESFLRSKGKMESGGDVLMEDTVQRIDDPNFADISYYAKGGVIPDSINKLYDYLTSQFKNTRFSINPTKYSNKVFTIRVWDDGFFRQRSNRGLGLSYADELRKKFKNLEIKTEPRLHNPQGHTTDHIIVKEK